MRQTEIAERLPDVFHTGAAPDDPLWALLGVMELLHERAEGVLGDFPRYLDPRTAPDELVPYLSWWLDLGWLLLDPPDDPYGEPGRPFAGGLGALRELAADAARASKWRGTKAGLVRMLELATGVSGFDVEEDVRGADGRRLPFTIRVVAPADAAPFADLVRAIALHEKPAHVVPMFAGGGFDAPDTTPPT